MFGVEVGFFGDELFDADEVDNEDRGGSSGGDGGGGAVGNFFAETWSNDRVRGGLVEAGFDSEVGFTEFGGEFLLAFGFGRDV